MVRFLGEVDRWRLEILAALDPETEERVLANAILSEMSDGLKESVGRIVRTFGDKLGAFRFPPGVAKGLQTFLDYC